MNLPFGLYGERQVVAADSFHGPLFSIDPQTYADTEKAIAPIFQPGYPRFPKLRTWLPGTRLRR